MSKEQTVWRLTEVGKGPRTWRQHREPVPVPKPGQYLVRIHAVSLNFRDVAIAYGKYPVPVPNGIVPGSDLAGEIVFGGEHTSKFKPGDKVTYLVDETYLYGPASLGTYIGGPLDGTLQEYRCCEEIALLKAPDYLSYEELSTFATAGVTAWNALYGLKPLLPGQTVLVQGTGGVSLFGLAIAARAGARVIVTSASDDKLARATTLGAAHTVNYARTPDWAAEAQRLTRGAGADHVLDNVGLGGMAQSFGAVAPGGVITSIGFLGDQSASSTNIPLLALARQATLRGIVMGSKEQFEELLQFAAANEVHPHIDRMFSFEQAAEALQYLASGKHFGKVVVRVSADSATGCKGCEGSGLSDSKTVVDVGVEARPGETRCKSCRVKISKLTKSAIAAVR